MALADLFDVEKQLIFYGAYHSNKVNVRIHMLCVPILIWTGQMIFASVPLPSFIPDLHYEINPFLFFSLNWATILSALYLTYYYALLPSAAASYTPQMLLSLLTANAIMRDPQNLRYAVAVHVSSWIAQVYGHNVHEGRAPALLDNLIGALVLAPFFVHLELLFSLGYYSDLNRRIVNGVGKEILRFRTEAAAKKRAE